MTFIRATFIYKAIAVYLVYSCLPFIAFGAELPSDRQAPQISCAEALKTIGYANIQFSIPTLISSGFVLKPEQIVIPEEIRNQPQIRTVSDKWNFNHLLEGRQPVKVGKVEDHETFSRQGLVSVLDMPIKFPGTDYFIPNNLIQLREALQRIINVEHGINPHALKNYFAYLTAHQSWVDPGEYQRRPGLHVDGFQGVERSEKEPIEHSYFVFNDVPTVFTRQLFQFFNFDFSRFNIFSEFDRQGNAELEFEATPYDINFADAYTVHRANVAKRRVLRTFIRITYSVAIFDRLGLTDNPLFPYSWERKEKHLQSTLQRYVPPTGIEGLTNMKSLAEIPGKRMGIIGIGEGSDGLQAAQIGALLKGVGKEVQFVASFRNKHAYLNGKDVQPGMVQVNKNFRMEGRLFEDTFSEDFNTYVVFDDTTQQMRAKLEWLAKTHSVDGFVFVDSGGNVLSPMFLQDHLLNDHRTLLAAESVNVQNKTALIVCPGINTPGNVHEMMNGLGAQRYKPSEQDRNLILGNYQRWGMAYPNPRTFAFIPMIWQQALRGEFGPQQFPTLYPGEPKYPVTPESQDLMVMPYTNLMSVIRGDKR